jgi:hypothetical protein
MPSSRASSGQPEPILGPGRSTAAQGDAVAPPGGPFGSMRQNARGRRPGAEVQPPHQPGEAGRCRPSLLGQHDALSERQLPGRAALAVDLRRAQEAVLNVVEGGDVLLGLNSTVDDAFPHLHRYSTLVGDELLHGQV